MSHYTYNRYPREQFITYAKRKDYIIAKDLEVKDNQGRKLNNKDLIERYEFMMRYIRDGNVTIDKLRDLKRLMELEKEKGIGANHYMPKHLQDEICELYQKFKQTNNDRRIWHYYIGFPAYFVKEVENFNKQEEFRNKPYEIIEPDQGRISMDAPEWKERERLAVERYLAQIAAEKAEEEEAQHQAQMKAFGYSTCSVCEAELEDSQIGDDGVCIECAHNEEEEEEEDVVIDPFPSVAQLAAEELEQEKKEAAFEVERKIKIKVIKDQIEFLQAQLKDLEEKV